MAVREDCSSDVIDLAMAVSGGTNCSRDAGGPEHVESAQIFLSAGFSGLFSQYLKPANKGG